MVAAWPDCCWHLLATCTTITEWVQNAPFKRVALAARTRSWHRHRSNLQHHRRCCPSVCGPPQASTTQSHTTAAVKACANNSPCSYERSEFLGQASVLPRPLGSRQPSKVQGRKWQNLCLKTWLQVALQVLLRKATAASKDNTDLSSDQTKRTSALRGSGLVFLVGLRRLPACNNLVTRPVLSVKLRSAVAIS